MEAKEGECGDDAELYKGILIPEDGEPAAGGS